jgi:trehalose synthase
VLQTVDTEPRRLSAYDEHADPAMLSQIRTLAAQLRGLRVIHVNATPDGGGVAEILHSLVPLLQDLQIDAHWYVLPPDDGFFSVTKQLHNWLQGAPGEIDRAEQQTYQAYLERQARQMDQLAADIWVIHDPQPLALRTLVPLRGRAVWRCHIDCSTPNGGVKKYLLPWIQRYDRALFSMPEYVLPGVSADRVRIVYPAIDPVTAKNRPMSLSEARAILAGLDVDPTRPLVTQVSRFDRWKNPWEVVDAYRLAKRRVPALQLALVGTFAADDDPEGLKIYRDVREYAGPDSDAHLFTDPRQVGSREVNAFQTASSVIVQRSTREGFGLTVTEAMWKQRPVIATPVGGINVQIQDGHNGYLVESAEACAARIVRLLKDPQLVEEIGGAAHRSIRERFLVPRLVSDALQFVPRPRHGPGRYERDRLVARNSPVSPVASTYVTRTWLPR